MLAVGVLGPVEARRDGVLLSLPAGKTTELLARLALDAGRRVRVDVLVDDLWDEPTARNTLQSKVSALRRSIGKEFVVGSAEGYQLALPPDCVDAVRAVRLASTSADARTAGDIAAALSAAQEGLALFRGEVLPDAGAWAAAHRTRLGEVRSSLLEQMLAARVDLGAGGEIVAELESAIESDPLREGLWATLITALYRAGRQGDALAAYARVRRRLVDELGVEPGLALRSLERQVLQQSPQLGAGGAAAREARPLAGPGNLPTPEPPGIGRLGDLDDVTAALGPHRLVTILGPGGIGKTRLALEVAHRLDPPPGGVWLVRLDGVDAGADLFTLVAETLHVAGGARAVQERLSGAETVLVLDNCEHLAATVAPFVRLLLDAAPRLRVLVTSQARLGLLDEHPHVLLPLSQQDSVTLFSRRAGEQRRQLALDPDTAAAVEEICRSLDGLPLAIELAAARVRSLSIRDIARRLDSRFTLLRDPSSARPERRRALVGAIGWSYDLLFPDDQRALWGLSCFAGSASLSALEHVLAALAVPAEAVLDTIGRLVDRSLVSLDAGPDGEVRYRLLDSIRLYAADRLGEAGLQDIASAAHAAWYARTAAWCDAHVRAAAQPACLAIARAERANIDAALSWCTRHDPLLGLRIANGFGWTWVILGDGTAGASRVRNAIVEQAPPADQVTALLLASWLEASTGNVELAQAELDRARRLAARPATSRDRRGADRSPTTDVPAEVALADIDRHQAFLAIQEGRPELARSAAAGSVVIYRSCGLAWGTAASLLLDAFGSIMLGDPTTATRDATEALEILLPIGDSWGVVHAQAMLGAIAQAEHRFDDAGRALERAADESAAMGFLGQAALHRTTLARVRHRARDPRAERSYLDALEAAAACGDGRLAATARVNLARLRRSAADQAGAVSLLQENERWYAVTGGGDFALLTSCLLAATRDDAAALTTVLAQAKTDGNAEVAVHALDAHARLAVAAGDDSLARALLAEADALAPSAAHALDEADRTDAAAARLALAGR
ncbi:BTAD domain-containing putative transcriptional regulator [Microlunatus ginsengisoli]|uniref:BTAD domain-containing putative transcriptional regulator n=1 Tax=Microlunatus ginsengisoli TaxID=363863 RepID=A0ABP7A0B9_9ACTN